MHRPSKTALLRFVRSQMLPMLGLAVVVLSVRTAVADWHDVPTGSMIPTIRIGDRIVVDKTAYGLRLPFSEIWLARWDTPQRGQIVTCHSPADGTLLVKRVCAVSGDVVEMRENRLLVNGVAAEYESVPVEPFARDLPQGESSHVAFIERTPEFEHLVLFTPAQRAPRDFGPLTVPDGRYLMMGDNRDQSADSRYFGFVPVEAITGRAHRVAFSLDRAHGWRIRADRFLHALR